MGWKNIMSHKREDFWNRISAKEDLVLPFQTANFAVRFLFIWPLPMGEH